MTVNDLARGLGLEALHLEDGERPIEGGYVGDLLSWVMGKAGKNHAWITIMSNLNTIAVAVLTDVSLVILAEGVTTDDAVLSRAKQQGVNLMTSPLSSFELAGRCYALLSDSGA